MVAKLPHGWYKGKIRETNIIDTIESSIGRYDIALVELAEDNEITQRERESKTVSENKEKVRIRKLTPRECYRLMGFSDEDFDKAKQVNSDTQLYKQAGNSIVVNVLEEIFKEML